MQPRRTRPTRTLPLLRLQVLALIAGAWLAIPAHGDTVRTLKLHGKGGSPNAPTFTRSDPSPQPTASATTASEPSTPTATSSSQPGGEATYQIYYGNDAYLNAYRRVIRSYNPRLSNDDLESIVRSILYYSHLFKIDPRFVVAVVACESAFRPRAVSGAGAGGLGQLMPETARELGVKMFVPYQNIQGTVRYLKLNLDRFKSSSKREQMRLALASYNAGYGAVLKYGGVPPYSETQSYVRVVMNEYTRLSGNR